MQLINEEQFAEMQSDLAELIGLIQSAQNNFNPKQLQVQILSEFKKNLSFYFSPFKSLEREALEIEDSLRELKKVKKVFYECKNKSDLKLIIISIVSMFTGGILTLIIIKFINI
jgi:hypothetical protein